MVLDRSPQEVCCDRVSICFDLRAYVQERYELSNPLPNMEAITGGQMP